jgi:hypothetical protein
MVVGSYSLATVAQGKLVGFHTPGAERGCNGVVVGNSVDIENSVAVPVAGTRFECTEVAVVEGMMMVAANMAACTVVVIVV